MSWYELNLNTSIYLGNEPANLLDLTRYPISLY